MRLSIAVFIGIAIVPFLAGHSQARTWRVLADGSGDAPTIRAAVDSAQSGDEIIVGPGTYTWTSESAGDDHSMIHMKPDLILRSEAGPEATVLDGEDLGRLIYVIDAADVTIEGLTIQNGFGFPGGDVLSSCGGGIVSMGSNLQIKNCVIRENFALTGGGVYLVDGGGTALVEACTISDNQAYWSGRGGGGLAGGGLTMSKCVIRNNRGRHFGGGLKVASSLIQDCIIEGNRAIGQTSSGGGGAKSFGGTEFRRCLFLNNSASGPIRNAVGGGLSTEGSCTLVECVFVGNLAEAPRNAYGAAIGAFSLPTGVATLTVDRCTIVGNRGVTNGGNATGGIFIDDDATGTVTSSIIAWNTGAATRATNATFSCTNVFGNTGGDAIVGIDAGTNFSADPQFCSVDPMATLDFGLQEDSPCAPGNHPSGASCGLVGTSPVQCDAVGVENRSWGEIKSLYRR